ncbi:MAG: hypothetical protein LUD14_02530 [Clostridiales bacterium]|nr:hypothetical protein [Clostridiales bacterium]
MKTLFHVAGSLYSQYRDDLMISLLVCTVLLMIIALFAVRRCRRQVRELAEKTGEMTKAALSQGGRDVRRGKETRRSAEESAESVPPARSRKNEEVFGSVIHEIFP